MLFHTVGCETSINLIGHCEYFFFFFLQRCRDEILNSIYETRKYNLYKVS